MTLTEMVFNTVPFYPEHASVPELAKKLGVDTEKVRRSIVSMDCSLPLAEDDGGLYTRTDSRPYKRKWGRSNG